MDAKITFVFNSHGVETRLPLSEPSIGSINGSHRARQLL